MSRFKRLPNRNQAKIKSDIEETSKITREDVYGLIKDTETREEAEALVREFFPEVNRSVKSFKRYGQEDSIERIISDLDSYMEWDEEH